MIMQIVIPSPVHENIVAVKDAEMLELKTPEREENIDSRVISTRDESEIKKPIHLTDICLRNLSYPCKDP